MTTSPACTRAPYDPAHQAADTPSRLPCARGGQPQHRGACRTASQEGCPAVQAEEASVRRLPALRLLQRGLQVGLRLAASWSAVAAELLRTGRCAGRTWAYACSTRRAWSLLAGAGCACRCMSLSGWLSMVPCSALLLLQDHARVKRLLAAAPGMHSSLSALQRHSWCAAHGVRAAGRHQRQ